MKAATCLNQVFVNGKYIGSIHCNAAGNWSAYQDGKEFVFIGQFARKEAISFLAA